MAEAKRRTAFIGERDLKIIEMFEAGIDDADIADALGMTEHNVQVRRLRLGYRKEFRCNGNRKMERDEVIRSLFESGLNDQNIGKDPRVNLKGSTIRIERIRLGLKRKRSAIETYAHRALALIQMPMTEPIEEWFEGNVKVQRFRPGYARGFPANIMSGYKGVL